MTATSRPLVSVVTPFHNTDAYLAECIESVLAQTFSDFEYVLVNNCSTDRSVEIAEGYARRDSRIRLEHNDRFLTQIQNYNQALRRVSPASRYVKMAQADDALFPRCLEEMVALAEAHPEIGIVGSYRHYGDSVLPASFPRARTVMTGREAARLFLLDDVFAFGSQTTVMMRADVVRAKALFYPEDRLFSDTDAVLDILRDHGFGFVHQILSFTRMDNDSIWTRLETQNFGAVILHELIAIKTFGRTYLDAPEYERRVGEKERAYRFFLANAWIRRREPEFWEFHRKGLASIGETIERSRLLVDALGVVLHHLVRPQTLCAKVMRRLRKPAVPASSTGA